MSVNTISTGSPRYVDRNGVARLLGYGGLIPFVVLAATSIALPGESAWLGFALMTYGACIASFIGAVHWGRWLAGMMHGSGALIWSVVPMLAAWLTLLLSAPFGLVALSVVLIVCAVVDFRLGRSDLLPRWYLDMRVWLTTVAVISLLIAAAHAAAHTR